MKKGTLTDREYDVFRLILKGLSNKEIGYDLFVSEKTIRFHTTNIYRKLNVRDRVALVIKYAGGYFVEDELVITVEQARESIKVINELALFAANHNIHTEEVKELVAVTNILKKILSSNVAHKVIPCLST